ncbi:MAG: hypothetical protein KC502_17915 [Myxococcales bacterium]|nr:hypothetical protein [Myxococcales bacterium]
MGKLAFGFIALIFGVQLLTFTLRRRCPRCKRLYGGRFVSAYRSGVTTRRSPVNPLEPNGIFGRKMQTTTSGTRHVTVRCRRCGNTWGYSGRFSSSREDP